MHQIAFLQYFENMKQGSVIASVVISPRGNMHLQQFVVTYLFSQFSLVDFLTNIIVENNISRLQITRQVQIMI